MAGAAGFRWRRSMNPGIQPLIQSFPLVDTVVLSEGELVNLQVGEVDPAVTTDTELLGPALEAVDNTDDGLSVNVIVNRDAVYAVADANIRLAGATLDIAAGGLTVAASANADLLVVEDSTAAEDTLVTINAGSHAFE